MQVPDPIHRLADALPVPVRRVGYKVAYLGLRVYWFLRRPDTSGVKCVLTDGELILLVRHTYGPRGWELPGGSMNSGEEPIDAARREINEELGIAVHEFTKLGQMAVHSDHRDDHVYYFRAEVSAPRLTIDRGELRTARWFPRDQLPLRMGRYARRIIAALPREV